MPLLNVVCPFDGTALEVSLELLGDPPMFNLATSPAFVEHMNINHGAQMTPVEEWPPSTAPIHNEWDVYQAERHHNHQ